MKYIVITVVIVSMLVFAYQHLQTDEREKSTDTIREESSDTKESSATIREIPRSVDRKPYRFVEREIISNS